MNIPNEKQIEVENLLRSVDGKMSSEQIEEILGYIKKEDVFLDGKKKETVDELKLKLLDETNWRKRASIAAMIISKDLE